MLWWDSIVQQIKASIAQRKDRKTIDDGKRVPIRQAGFMADCCVLAGQYSSANEGESSG
jgi:hypothetical protein